MHPGSRFFVTGTDTGVGKTEVAAALLDLMRERKLDPFALKPYQSGGIEDSRELNAKVVYQFDEPLAPGVAAEREGLKPSLARVIAAIPKQGAGIVEGAGGLFVPIDTKRDIIDLIEKLNLPVILVARAGLGTLNHTTLSLEALGTRRVKVTAVVLVKSTPGKDVSEEDNAKWLKRRHPDLKVLGPVPFIRDKKKRRAALRRVLAAVIN